MLLSNLRFYALGEFDSVNIISIASRLKLPVFAVVWTWTTIKIVIIRLLLIISYRRRVLNHQSLCGYPRLIIKPTFFQLFCLYSFCVAKVFFWLFQLIVLFPLYNLFIFLICKLLLKNFVYITFPSYGFTFGLLYELILTLNKLSCLFDVWLVVLI